ncbi:MAG: ribosome biogenesis GTPase YlqF, partial [Clostridia bacterium]
INWYPGHMVKAQNDIKENLKLIDIVVEVLDARIPISSQNPIIDKLALNKARIIVLNKADLADDTITKTWKLKFEKEGISCIVINAVICDNIKKLINEICIKGEAVYKEKYKNRNIEIAIKPIYRVLIVGIPNVGKSTIINKIAKRPVTNVGNKPGVTKKKQWIRVAGNIDLLDTPGLLWPRLDNEDAGLKLALTGNIKKEVLDIEELAIEGLRLLTAHDKYSAMICDKYSLSDEDIALEPYYLLEVIGKKRGCIISGGKVDMEKAGSLFVDDLKNGKIGRITLE